MTVCGQANYLSVALSLHQEELSFLSLWGTVVKSSTGLTGWGYGESPVSPSRFHMAGDVLYL